MNRREVLRSAALLALPPWPPVAARGGDPVRLMTVIYDERYGEARAFARQAGRRGAVLLPTRGDATGLWYGGSGAALGQMGGAVAGVTTYPDLVIARSRSRELGSRLAFEERLDRCFDATGTDAVAHPSHLLIWLLLPRRAGAQRF